MKTQRTLRHWLSALLAAAFIITGLGATAGACTDGIIGFPSADLWKIADLIPRDKEVYAYIAVRFTDAVEIRKYIEAKLLIHGVMPGDLKAQTFPRNFASVTYFRIPLSGREILEACTKKEVLGITIAKQDLESFKIQLERPSLAKVSENLVDLLPFAAKGERFRSAIMLTEAWQHLSEETKSKIKQSGVDVIDIGFGGTYLLVETTIDAIKALQNEPTIQAFGAP